MSDELNGLIRVRKNADDERKRLEVLVNRSGPNFADRYILGKIDVLKWIGMNLTIEIQTLQQKMGGFNVKEKDNN